MLLKFPKSKRIVNKELLKKYRDLPCVLIDHVPRLCKGIVAAHHIKTKGSGGNDTEENCLALCFFHHRLIHDIGTEKFLRMYPELTTRLAKNK